MNTLKLLHLGIFTTTFLFLAHSSFAQEAVSTITAGEKVDVDFAVARAEFETVYADLAISEPEVAEYMREEFESFERGELTFGNFERSFVERGIEGMREGFESHYQEALARGDTLAAEMMKAGFEACERGEYAAVGQMDFTAMRSEFEQHYQEALAKGDVTEAEQMKHGWEVFEKGDVRSVMMDPEEMKDSFEKVYQEALASGNTSLAEQMKDQFVANIDHYQSGGEPIGHGPIDQEHPITTDQQQPTNQQPTDQQQQDQQQNVEHFQSERNTEQIQEQNTEKYNHCILNPDDPACKH